MFIYFIRLSILFIGLLANDLIIGMMSSSNSSWDVLVLNQDIIKHNIFPQCSFSDSLNMRAICNNLKERCDTIILNGASFDETFHKKIYSTYHDKSPSSAFLVCIYEKKHDEVEWFLKSKMYQPLFVIHNLNYPIYSFINSRDLISSNDAKMQQLFNKYNSNKFYSDVIDIQEHYCIPLHLKKRIEELEKTSELLNKNGTEIDSLSNNGSVNKSEREYELLEFKHIIINHERNCKLVMSACMGNIKIFNSQMKTISDSISYSNDGTPDLCVEDQCFLFLSLWVAVKNKDFKFVIHLLKNDFFISAFDSNSLTSVLASFLLKRDAKHSGGEIIVPYQSSLSNEYFDDKHIEWIKRLIGENAFTVMPELIKLNKDNNKYVKEIYDILNAKLIEQKSKSFFVVCFQPIQNFFQSWK